jgi:4-amino-4-deoxy-L-arabinose transferase-like glycosyltransferase
VLFCELISHPFTAMGVGDDGPYILMARTLANTGHIIYNGWASPMLTAQLYLGAAFIRIFGFSFTTVRMSTLLVAVLLAFLLQRTFVRAGLNERNATVGTLALVSSPLYLLLSVSFMSDITGVFALVICLYGCLRTLQSNTHRSTLLWLCFAVTTNVFFGTSRQIAWLGTLVMVPCTLWLLRTQRRLLVLGAAVNVAGALIIFLCMHWLKHQRYTIPLPLYIPDFPVAHAFGQLGILLLDCPFLILPIVAIFLPELRKSRPLVLALFSTVLLSFIFLATFPSHVRGYFQPLLAPIGGIGSWVNVGGIIDVFILPKMPPLFLSPSLQVAFTVLSIGGLFGVIFSLFHLRRHHAPVNASVSTSWKQLAALVAPLCAAYLLLLFLTAGTAYLLYDRYALGLLALLLPCLIRFYQERIQSQLPSTTMLLIAIMAIYGVVLTHNTFALDRARVALADELHANGTPDTALDGSWEANLDVELRHADHVNNPILKTVANGYTPVRPPPPGPCQMSWYYKTPHIHALYGVSFDPAACYGLAPFPPVHYSRWPYRTPGTLYIVRYTPAARP